MIPQVFHSPDAGGGGMSGNPLELVIGLGIDAKSAQTNLQNEINKLKDIQKIVDLKIADNAMNNLQSQINKLNTNVKVSAQLDIDKTLTLINSQMTDLNRKLPRVTLEGKLDTKATKENIKKQLKGIKIEEKVTPTPNDPKPVKSTPSPKVKVDSVDFKSYDDILKKYSNKEYKIKVQRDELDGAIKQIQVIGKLAHNLQQNLTFKPSIDKNGLEGFNKAVSTTTDTVKVGLTEGLTQAKKKLEDLGKSGKVSVNSLNGMKIHLDNLTKKLNDGSLEGKHLENFNNRLKDTTRNLTSVPSFLNNIKSAQDKLDSAMHKGLLTQQQYIQEMQKLNNIKLNGSNFELNGFKSSVNDIINSTKRMNELGKAVHDVGMKEKEILTLMERLQRQNPKTFDTDKAKNLKQQMESLLTIYKQMDNNKQLKFGNLGEANQVKQKLQEINAQMKQLGAEAQQAGRNSMTLWDSFKVAMSKFPVWMGASTVFYALTNGAKELTQTIIEVDTRMTNLKKVMSPDTDFDNLFTQATEDAKMFGQTLTDVLDSYNEFAKQGFKGDELQDLAQVGLVTANVGELSAQDASQFITSTLIQWKKDTSSAMGIIDQWNQLSNNYAVSTQQLAEANAKAAAVADGMGVTFEQFNSMVGVISAATRQSGSEVGNSLKAILPRLTQQTGQDALASLGVDLTDQAGNMRNVIDIYKEVADKMKNLNEVEKAQVVMGLGGTYHRTRLQALLDDLGKVDSMYDQMYNSAANESQGSAMRENDTYMQSLEARIGKMKASFQELAVAIGEAFLSEGMITFFETVAGGVQLLTKLTSAIGALPMAFAATTVAVVLLSKKFQSLLLSMGTYIARAAVAKTSTTALGTAVQATTAKLSTFSRTAKLALASIGIGLALVGVGAGFEYLAKKQEEARQRAETLKNQNKQLKDSYEENGDTVNNLVKQMEILETKKGTPDYNEQDEQKYLDIKNELAKLLPNLAVGTDEYGNAIMGNSLVISDQLELLQSQIDKEKELAQIKADADAQEKIKTDQKDLKGYEKAANQDRNVVEFVANRNSAANKELGKVKINDDTSHTEAISIMSQRVKDLERLAAEAHQKGMDGYSDKLTTQANVLKERLGDYANSAQMVSAKTAQVNNSLSTFATTAISKTSQLNDSGKKFLNGFITQLNATQQESDKLEKFYENFKIELNTEEFQEELKNLQSVMDQVNLNKEKYEAGEIDLDEFKQSRAELDSEVTAVTDTLKRLGKENNLDLTSVIADFETSAKSMYNLKDATEQAGVPLEDAKARMMEFGDVSSDTAEDLSEVVQKMYQFSSAAEAMAGITQDGAAQVDNAISTFHIMAGTVEENTVQYDYLQQQIALLIGAFPEYTQALGGTIEQQRNAIDAIETENNARKVLMEAYDEEVAGKLSGEGLKTRSAVQGTNNRIQAMRTELDALNDLLQAWKGYADAANAAISAAEAATTPDDFTMSSANNVDTLQQEKLSKQAKNKVEQLQSSKKISTAEIDKEIANLDSLSNSLSNHVATAKEAIKATDGGTKASKGKTKATKDSSKATKKDTKDTKENADANLSQKEALLQVNTLLDEYKNKLAKIETKLSKVGYIQSQYAKSSKEYREAIKKEIELTKQKIGVLKQQYDAQKVAADLNASMDTPYTYSSSGSDSSSSGYTTTSSGGGSNYSGQYADIINKYAKQYNVDAALIAAVIKQESGFNAKAYNKGSGATGLMQLIPSTARSLGVTNAYDPDQNIMGGTKYLSQLLKQFNGDVKKALAGYNWGPNRAAIRNGNYSAMPRETQNYVTKVPQYYEQYKKSGIGGSTKTSSVEKTTKANTKAIEKNTKATTKSTKAVSTPKNPSKAWYKANFNQELTNGRGNGKYGLQKYVADIEADIASRFKLTKASGGYAYRNKVGGNSLSEHSYGRAIDFFATPAEMQKIADTLVHHPLVQHVIYNKKVSSYGQEWKNYMTKPGLNAHTDHVHVDFLKPDGTSAGTSGRKPKNVNRVYAADMSLFKSGGTGANVGNGENVSIDPNATGVTDASSYEQIMQAIYDAQQKQNELVAGLVESYLAVYEEKIQKWTDRNAIFQAGQSKYSTYSEKYRKYNNNILANEKKIYRETQAEAKTLKGFIQEGKVDGEPISPAKIEEFKSQLRELNISLAEQSVKIKEIRYDNITSKLESFSKAIEKAERVVSLNSAKQNKVTSDSKRYRELQNNNINQLRKEYRETDKQARYASQELTKDKKRTNFSASKKKTIQTKRDKAKEKVDKTQNKIKENKTKVANSKITFTKKDKTRMETLQNKTKKTVKLSSSESKTLAQLEKKQKEKVKLSKKENETLKKLKKKQKEKVKLTDKEQKELKKLQKNQKIAANKKNKLTDKEIKKLEKAIKEDRTTRDKNKTAYKKYTKQLRNNGKLLTQKDKDELQIELEELRIKREEQRVAISDAYMAKIQSYRDGYQYKSSVREYAINRDTHKRNQQDSSSAKYRSMTTDNIKNMKTQLSLKRQELNKITQQMKQTDLTAAAMRELTEAQRELKIGLLESLEAIQEERDARLRSSIEAHDNKINEYSYLQTMSEMYQSNLTPDSDGYNEQLSFQADFVAKQIEEMTAKAADFYKAAQNVEFSVDQRKGYLQEWRDVRTSMATLVKEQMDANKQLADEFVSLMKKAYEKKREMAIKAIDDERTAYSKLINDMIEAIDKSERELTHEEERTDKNDEITKKKKKADSLALDDSQAAKAERKKLLEEIEELEKDYTKWERQYNNEQKKEALQEQLEEKNEQLDDEQKAVERFYENILEDERRWAKMSKDILEGNVDAYIKEFQQMGVFVTNNLTDIGEAIGTTLIDQFNNAIASMQTLTTTTQQYQAIWADLQSQGVFNDAGSYNKAPSSTPDLSDSKGNLKYVANKNMKLTEQKDGSGTSYDVEAGKVLTVTKENDGYAYVKLQDGREGWTSKDNLSINYTQEKEKIKTDKEAKLYTEASQKSTALTKIAAKTALEVLGKSGDFYKVKYNGQEGYVHKNNLDMTSSYSTSKTTTTNDNTYKTETEKKKDYVLQYAQQDVAIRKTSDPSSAVVDNFKVGKALKIDNSVASKNGYVKVVWNDGANSGWIKASLLGDTKPSTPNTTGTSTKGNENKRKVLERAPLYEKKDASGAYYGKIDPNEKVELVGEAVATGLQKVKYKNKTGWIDAQKLTRFDTGGLTGNWSGNEGKLAMLHKKELVLNNEQTAHILEVAKLLNGFNLPKTPEIQVPSIPFPTGENNSSPISVESLVNIENFTGTKQEKDNLAKDLWNGLNKLGANIKRI